MTYNQIVTLLEDIQIAHEQLKAFGIGEEHEINGAKESERIYPKVWFIPIDSVTRENTKERTFEMLVFDLVDKEENNEIHVQSDTEQMADDYVKVLKYEAVGYTLLGDPQLFPFTEKYADDVTGWRGNITIETQFNNNYCDTPINEI